MSDRNNQGSGNSWAWIIGTGVAAVAGTVLAIMATNTKPTIYDFDDASSTSSLGEEVDGQPQKLCIICFRHLDKAPVRELTCRHLFHSCCITKWLGQSKNCPMCRRPVSPDGLLS